MHRHRECDHRFRVPLRSTAISSRCRCRGEVALRRADRKSGFQTIALCFRLFIQSGIIIESSIGSPGLDELRWFAPVRPEDTLHTEVEVLELKPSRSKPDRGIVRMRYEAINQRGEKVLSFIANHLLLKRPA